MFIYVFFHNYNLDENLHIEENTFQEIIVHDKLNYNSDYNITFIGKIKGDKYLISVPKNIVDDDIKYGDVLTTNSFKVQPIKNMYQNPSSFDYKKYMRQQSVTTKLIIKEYKISSIFNIMYLVNNFRFKMVSTININKPSLAPYMNTLIFGDNSIDQDMKKVFSSVGITHALTISGTHVLLLITFYKKVLRSFNVYEGYIEKSLLVILPIYSLVTGAQIPIMRAVLVELGHILLQDRIAKIEILKIICLINLLYNPNILFSISFLLSYTISFFIYFLEYFDFKNNKFLNYLKPSLLIMLVIFPIICNLNYQYNVLSFICSVILTPIITLVLLPLAYINLIFSETSIFGFLFLHVIKLVESIAYFFDYFTLTTGHISWFFIIVYYFIYFLYYYNKHMVYLSMLALMVFFSFLNMNIVGSVSVIDVKQGDSIFIQYPFNGENILIDTGPEASKHELVKYLQYMGVDKIDHLFISHWHEDHYGGNEMLFSKFKVKNIYSFKSSSEPANYQNITYIKAGDELVIGNVKIKVLAPFKADENLNNESLTILMNLGGANWLFTGDIEREVELEIIKHFGHLLDIDYLKVPHHGSKTSSTEEFIKATSPKVAMISVGENNKFKHPSKEVIDRYEAMNIKTLQTKDHGNIRFNFIFKYIWYNKYKK
jgi:competence protein ComEC